MRPRVLNFSRPLYVRELMLENGDAHKPILFSELDWSPVPEDVLTGEARSAPVTPTLALALGITSAVVIAVGIFPSILSELGEMTKVFVAGF